MFEMHSQDIKELSKALALVQSEMQVAGKKKDNPFFKSKYADFQSVVEASRPAMVKNDLSITQIITEKEEGSYLVTMLMHNSGQFLRSVKKISPTKPDIQSYSSYVTYCKRMSYSALLGVVCADEDDDGEQAVRNNENNEEQAVSSHHRKNVKAVPVEEKVTTEQLEVLWHELQDEQELAESILKAFKIKQLSEMPKDKFLSVISRIREIKNDQN